MLAFGDLVLQKYRILRNTTRRDGLLGRGAFGSVFLAYEQPADRLVAIKELTFGHDDSDDRDEALQRFLTEGRLGLRVRHPNILEVYVIEPYEDGYLLVMELAEGGDVKTLLNTSRPTFGQAVAIAAGVAEGLQAAHSLGIVHRDLKPGNLFLMRDGTPKVADFGVAHIPQAVGGYHSLTRTGFQPGTVIYMSPEQAAGRRVDSRSDLYALAVILFEMLTGHFYIDLERCRAEARSRSVKTPSLEEFHFFQVFSELAFEGPPPHPRTIDPTIPEWLDEVVVRGLARDPDERWQSGHEFATAMRAGEIPPDSRPLSLPPPPRAAEPPPPPVDAPTLAIAPTPRPDGSTPAQPVETAAAAPARPPARRRGPLLFGAASVLLLTLLVGGYLVARGGSGSRQRGTATVASVTATNASRAASASASPPAFTAATVPDRAVTRTGTTLVQRVNVPGQSGDPGYVATFTKDSAASACPQPHIDILRPDAGGVWRSVFDAASQPDGSPLLTKAAAQGKDCVPEVTQLSAQPLAPGGQPVTLAVVTDADQSVRLLALTYATNENAVRVLYDLHTTPHGQIALNLTPPAQFTVTENAFPPADSGLEPQNDKPIGTLRLAYSWSNSTFNLNTAPQFTPGCASGTVELVTAKALLLQCPAGSVAPYTAASIDGSTIFTGGITAAALAPGDDVTLAYGGKSATATRPPATATSGTTAAHPSAEPADEDPLQQLPHAATLSSQSAEKRLSATPTPAPRTSAPTRAPTATSYSAPAYPSATRAY